MWWIFVEKLTGKILRPAARPRDADVIGQGTTGLRCSRKVPHEWKGRPLLSGVPCVLSYPLFLRRCRTKEGTLQEAWTPVSISQTTTADRASIS